MKSVKLFGTEIRRSIGFMLCYATLAQAVPCQSILSEASPASLVQNYCRLDQEGARLSSQDPNHERIFALVTWPEEPGWDSVVVIKNFAVVRSNSRQPKSSVTVRYTLLGRMTGADVIAFRQHEEMVTFVLDRSGDTWKIKQPLIPPHISAQTAIAALDSLLKDEKDPEQRRRLNAGISALAQWER